MKITGTTRLAGIMGWPVVPFPLAVAAWLLARRDRDRRRLCAVAGAAGATSQQALRALPILGFRGCNLTIPHKQTALSVVDRVEPLARRIGAVNTIVVAPDGSLEAQQHRCVRVSREPARGGARIGGPTAGPAVILGAGGSARAVVAASTDAGVAEIRIVNRTLARAEAVAERSRNTDGADNGPSLGARPAMSSAMPGFWSTRRASA